MDDLLLKKTSSNKYFIFWPVKYYKILLEICSELTREQNCIIWETLMKNENQQMKN